MAHNGTRAGIMRKSPRHRGVPQRWQGLPGGRSPCNGKRDALLSPRGRSTTGQPERRLSVEWKPQTANDPRDTCHEGMYRLLGHTRRNCVLQLLGRLGPRRALTQPCKTRSAQGRSVEPRPQRWPLWRQKRLSGSGRMRPEFRHCGTQSAPVQRDLGDCAGKTGAVGTGERGG